MDRNDYYGGESTSLNLNQVGYVLKIDALVNWKALQWSYDINLFLYVL